jgi:MYXO-CTERM domain-containing protein
MRPMRHVSVLALGVLVSGIPSISHADRVASGLVISEVGYDTLAESNAATSAEYIEIYNPTSSRIALTAAAGAPSVYLSDSPTQYWKLPAGNVLVGNTADFLWQFPAGASIAPHSFVVVCADSTAFLAEFYDGSLATFEGLPGAPQLFEGTQDGAADGVGDMVNASTAPSQSILTNGGETVVLFQWDGRTDLVQDLDIVVWQSTTQVTNKTGQSVDGPDADTVATTYAADAAQSTRLAGPVPQSSVFGLARLELRELGEADAGGNGVGGHDETSESFDTGSAWGYLAHSPGLPPLVADASIADALSFLAPAAVSAADGPGGSGAPVDFGADGTVTELYVATADLDADRVPESLYVAVRGDLFGEPDGDANASFVLVDLDPTESTGATLLAGEGTQLGDIVGALDTRITGAGFLLDPALIAAGAGFDAAVGVDGSLVTADNGGWRSFGSGGGAGSLTDFAFGPTPARFQGAIDASYPGAPGSSYAAPDGFEADIPLATLAGGMPAFIRLVAVTTSDTPGAPSPNTLPESTGDDFGTPHVITAAVCYDVAAGRVVHYFVDADGDGAGTTVEVPYCGPAQAGVSTSSLDCDDTDSTRHPGAAELCNGIDDDCDGTIPADEADADADGVMICEGDCNDARNDVNPLVPEVCDGTTDEDCDGLVDDADPSATGQSPFFVDADGDGAGDATRPVQACAAAPGRVATGDDCDDSTAQVSPSLPEVCDPANVDENCSGAADDADPGATGKSSFFVDADGDGFVPGAAHPRCAASGIVRASVGADCDDGAASVHPGATETCNGADDDCDGALPANEADADGDTVRVCEGDCNDANAAVHPGALEMCNGTDDNCDGAVPANEADADSDGFRSCSGDCNDNAATVHPGAAEACNGRDDDCDGNVPANEADADSDGARVCAGDCDDGAAGIHPGAVEVCNGIDDNCDGNVPAGEADGDADGVRACAGDCNDADPAVRPGATEVCNASDDDCDGMVDDNASDAATFFADGDRDGFGNAAVSQRACSAPAGFVANAGDCNDANAAVRPGATELCNGVDDDCDLATDEGTQLAFYLDQDGDGFGGTSQTFGCSAPPGYVAAPGDCNDSAPAVHPGALEVCNGTDDDCDGAVPANELDADADGVRVCANDCDDANDAIHAGAMDVPGDGIDQDCSGADATGNDVDGDGVTDVTDCDDTNAAIHPGATEVCDGKDTDCDPATDENADDDNDGFSMCMDDCAIDDPAVNPGETETCNDVDDNCDGLVDEGFAHDGDGDGAENALCTGGSDCDDSDAEVHPGATDVAGDGVDQDCSGSDAVCMPSAEICTNGRDDDCDGFVDSDDSECVPARHDSGCGCTVAARPNPAPSAFALLALAALVPFRRRRRRRGHSPARK